MTSGVLEHGNSHSGRGTWGVSNENMTVYTAWNYVTMSITVEVIEEFVFTDTEWNLNRVQRC